MLYKDIELGLICRYHGVIHNIHGTMCKVVDIRGHKIDVVLLEGPMEGRTRRGMVSSMLRAYIPAEPTWEV